eukprot:TRINITY_DN47760_c0_g1_i1.p1 TRINITY_DN47760_c0_g1~~TRINITY_DN47760_c0_g1_i1.p1  ORF type:complete len:431 (+),score=89.93 TRINITY_DN47760_c0_g1_i1:59-1351(+)
MSTASFAQRTTSTRGFLNADVENASMNISVSQKASSRLTSDNRRARRGVLEQRSRGYPHPHHSRGLQDITNLQEGGGSRMGTIKGKSAVPRSSASESSLHAPVPGPVPMLGSIAAPKPPSTQPPTSLASLAPPPAGSLPPLRLAPLLGASSATLAPMPALGASPRAPAAASEDPQSVSEYMPDILERLFAEEKALTVNYMDAQADINSRMRAILLDWLVEVHLKYRLRPETLWLAQNLLDRFLTSVTVLRRKLQLAGVVALFIAAKFEEIHPPNVGDFVYITDNTYTKEDVLEWEVTMLSTLGFEIVTPTVAHFVDPFLMVNQSESGQHMALVRYILELTLLDVKMIRFTPSHLVSAAILLSNQLMGRSVAWPQAMVQNTRYTEQELRSTAEEMRALLRSMPTHTLQTIRRKFTMQQHKAVAKMPILNSL